MVLPTTANLTGPLAPVSDSPWLTITGVTNGVVSFAFTDNPMTVRAAHIALLGQSIPVIQMGSPNYSLGASNLWEGPVAGSEKIKFVTGGAWTATANDSWLHLSTANQGGAGSTNVVFRFDANPGATRTGTLTIASQTLTVTQVGSTYVAVTNAIPVVSSGLNKPYGVTVDGSGNIYIADTWNHAIKEWLAASNNVITLVSSGLLTPCGVAVDSSGNVYIADNAPGTVSEWIAASNTVTTLVYSGGLNEPYGVAVDSIGNVYIADTWNDAIKVWMAATNYVNTLVSSGLSVPHGVAMDGSGNVYIADTGNNAIKEWVAASNTVITLVSSGLNIPFGVAVDGIGNVYIADSHNNAIKEWVAASNIVSTLVSTGLRNPDGVAVDGAGNLFIANSGSNAIWNCRVPLWTTLQKWNRHQAAAIRCQRSCQSQPT